MKLDNDGKPPDTSPLCNDPIVDNLHHGYDEYEDYDNDDDNDDDDTTHY